MSIPGVDEMAMIDALARDLGVAPPEPGRVARVDTEDGAHRLSGLRWGSNRPSLVLLHGGSLNAHAWDAMFLLHGELDAVAIDLPGHGHSDWFDEPLYFPEELAVVIAPTIESLATAPVAIAGHSLGGLTALALAADRPDLIERLIVVDATPGSTPDRAADLVALASAGKFATFEELLDHVVAFKPHRERESLRRSVLLNAKPLDGGGWTWRHDSRDRPELDRWRRIYEELPKGWDHAARLQCPTLLVRGDRSRIVLATDVARYRDVVADLQVTEIADAGHNIHGDQPAALGAAITRFIAPTS